MGFVRTKEEIARIQQALAKPRFDSHYTVNSEGRGLVRLGHTVHDPLSDLTVVETLRGAYVEGDPIASAETLAYIKAADFLPYALGRTDDWSALDTETQPEIP